MFNKFINQQNFLWVGCWYCCHFSWLPYADDENGQVSNCKGFRITGTCGRMGRSSGLILITVTKRRSRNYGHTEEVTSLLENCEPK